MSEALDRVQRLEKYIRVFGEDSLVSSTLSKLFNVKLRQYRKELREVRRAKKRFENKYGMSSGQFLSKYEAGELGDETDYVEWASLCRMERRIAERMAMLEGQA